MPASSRTCSSPQLHIDLATERREPLHEQIYAGIREAILAGRLAAGTRVPSTRTLAKDLRVSRNTVLVAFDKLTAEGYLTSAVGSGSFVTSCVPDTILQVGKHFGPLSTNTAGPAPALGRRGWALLSLPGGAPRITPSTRPFRCGIPSVEDFPLRIWARLAARRYRGLDAMMLHHGHPAGFQPLREAIASYLQAARGVCCSPEQVIVVSSAQEALEFVTRMCLDPGDQAWIEEPGYLGARAALVAAGAEVIPIRVDGEGIDVPQGKVTAPNAKLAYVSPSHQYPIGVTMSLPRRLALLNWAAQAGAWIIEDDYDCEYRYFGRPLMALQGLDSAGHVIYIGTFSKTVFPSLRLGYLIAPAALAELFIASRGLSDQHAATIEQAILADFISEGHFARHVRRMRQLYAERQQVLLSAIARDLGDHIEIAPSDTGMHLLGWLNPALDDIAVSRAATSHRLELSPLSNSYLTPCQRGGLVFGYAGLRPHEISAGSRRLAEVFSILSFPATRALAC